MEFRKGGTRIKPKRSEYLSRLQLYRIPPVETLDIDEFEQLALLRLKRELILRSLYVASYSSLLC